VGHSLGGMFVLRIASQMVTLATIIILTRALGPDEFGRYAFLFGFLILFTLFNVNGLNDILVRDMVSRPDSREVIYRNGLALKLIAGLFAFTLACAIIIIFPISSLPTWVCCVAALTLFVSFSMGSVRMVWDVPYQVDFRMTSASVINLSGRLLFFVLLIIWILMSSADGATSLTKQPVFYIAGGVTVVILIQLFSEMSATAAQGGLNLRLRYRMLPDWNPEVIGYLFKEVWPLAIAGGLGMIYTKINLVMLQYFLTEREVGLFALPMRLVDALAIIPTVFIFAALPIISRMYRQSEEGFLALVKLSYRTMFCLSLPIAVVVASYSGAIVQILSGDAYSASAPVLTTLIWVSVLWFGGVAFNYTLIASGRQIMLMLIYGIQAVVSVGSNFILIPKFGLMGAVFATLITYFIMFPISLFFRQITYAGRLWFNSLLLPVGCALAAGYAAKAMGLSLLPGVFFIPAIFFSLVLITGFISRADIEMIRNIMKSRADTI